MATLEETAAPAGSHGRGELAGPGGVRRNTLFNLVGSAIPIAVAFVTVPLYLEAIGTVRYGILALAWALLGYFGLFLGLRRAVSNQIARASASDSTQWARVFWTASISNFVLGLVGGVAFYGIAYELVSDVLKMPDQIRAETISALPWLAAAVPFLTLSFAFLGTLEGLQRFAAANVIEVSAMLTWQVCPLIVALSFTVSLATLLPIVAASAVVSAVLGFVVCATALPSGARLEVDRVSARRLLEYGGWTTITEFLGPLLTVLDRFVIGAVFGARAVTYYTVPYSLISRLAILPFSLSRALFPRLSSTTAEQARDLSRRSSIVLVAVMTPLIVICLVVLGPFLRLWIGGEVAVQGAPVGVILLLGVWLNTVAFMPFTFLQSQGRPDLPAKFHAAQIAPYFVALWLALSHFGLQGAAWAWTGRVLVDTIMLAIAARLWTAEDAALWPAAFLVTATTLAELSVSDALVKLLLGSGAIAAALVHSWRVLGSNDLTVQKLKSVRLRFGKARL